MHLSLFVDVYVCVLCLCVVFVCCACVFVCCVCVLCLCVVFVFLCVSVCVYVFCVCEFMCVLSARVCIFHCFIICVSFRVRVLSCTYVFLCMCLLIGAEGGRAMEAATWKCQSLRAEAHTFVFCFDGGCLFCVSLTTLHTSSCASPTLQPHPIGVMVCRHVPTSRTPPTHPHEHSVGFVVASIS